MSDHNHADHNDSEESLFIQEPKSTEFVCPKDGKIARDDVVFLCNTCSKDDVIYKDGIYMCPSCLAPGQNFECMLCGSKEVKMKMKKAN